VQAPPPHKYLHLLLQNKARGLTTSRSSKSPFSDSADVIAEEIEVRQIEVRETISVRETGTEIETGTVAAAETGSTRYITLVTKGDLLLV
jgi:hypothetical protein